MKKSIYFLVNLEDYQGGWALYFGVKDCTAPHPVKKALIYDLAMAQVICDQLNKNIP